MMKEKLQGLDGQQGLQRHPSCLISKHFASLMNNLASFKEEIKRGQEEAAEQIVKKAKREQDYEFAKKGNKHKFDFKG